MSNFLPYIAVAFSLVALAVTVTNQSYRNGYMQGTADGVALAISHLAATK